MQRLRGELRRRRTVRSLRGEMVCEWGGDGDARVLGSGEIGEVVG